MSKAEKPVTNRAGPLFVCRMSPHSGPSSSRLTPRESAVSRSIHSKSAENKRVISFQTTTRTPPSAKKPPRFNLLSSASKGSDFTPPSSTDENKRPDWHSSRTPIDDRNCGQKGGSNKDVNEKTTGPFVTPSTTPLVHSAKVNRVPPQKRTAKSPSKPVYTSTTPKKGSKTPTSSVTPVRNDRVLFEFSEDILVTPSNNPSSGRTTPTLSLSSRSIVHLDTPRPMPRTHAPSSSTVRFNRSHSASIIVRKNSSSSTTTSSQSGGPTSGGVKRSCSEARLTEESLSSSHTRSTESIGENSHLTVGVRVRPLQSREHGNIVSVNGNEVSIASDLGALHIFSYDHCFISSGPGTSSQEDVYKAIAQPLLENAFLGYNACLFAYGQTGSGKTYSMMGTTTEDGVGIIPESGIILRFCYELLEKCSVPPENTIEGKKREVTSTVEVSYLEVYNEKIHDLLVPDTTALKVREHPIYGPYVVELSKHAVNSFKEIKHWINEGNKKRATAATEMNDKSSRSHSLFTIVLTQTFMQSNGDGVWTHEQTRTSTINLVDLAGSERIAHSSVSSDRLREGVSINRSLLTLGKVITSLIEKRSFVPYRESVLTWLLKESLGGNARTAMLATVSPCSANIDETLATLRYASQARAIVNTVRVNEAPQDKIIRELRAEIEQLKKLRLEVDKAKLNLSPPPTLTPTKIRNDKIRDQERELEILRQTLNQLRLQLDEKENKLKEAEANYETLTLRNRHLEERLNDAYRNEEHKGHLERTVKVIEEELLNLRVTLSETQSQLVERDIKFREAEVVLAELEKSKQCVEQKLMFLQEQDSENQHLISERGEQENILRTEIEVYREIVNQKEKEFEELDAKYNSAITELENVNRELQTNRNMLEWKDGNKISLKLEVSSCIDSFKSWQEEMNRNLQKSLQDFVTQTADTVKQNEAVIRGIIKDEDVRYNRIFEENKKIKEELIIANENLKKKSVTVEKLKKKVGTLEEYLNTEIKNINNKGKKKESNGSETSSSQQDLKMYEIVMETAYPFHWEHLLRKARTYAEKFNIPYDFEIDQASVTVKHLMFTAKSNWHRIFFSKWIETIEKEQRWTKEMDKDIIWEVDFGDYYKTPNPPPTRDELLFPDHIGSAINLGTEITRHGCICPRTWRKTLVKRHVLGLKEDANALTKHFASEGDCRVNIILNRINALINRLEVATELMEP